MLFAQERGNENQEQKARMVAGEQPQRGARPSSSRVHDDLVHHATVLV